ncbi:MAG: 3'-5' exonuclease domain-containing protein 2 [Desulfovibrionaceae bacterium]|nr:3'-5' exonuclease domain-containing protein 2 [Desulfovibrionaceae bacterium]
MALQHEPLATLRRRITHDEINTLPIVHYEGAVQLIRNAHDWEQALPDLQSEHVLGFDTETKPTFRKGRVNQPSLVQLATAHAVYLVQLVWMPFGEELASVLADPEIIKAGVGIRFDMQALGKLFPFGAQGTVDLGTVARLNKFSAQGLRTLAAVLFGWRISKGSQCSNWSLQDLSAKQIMYAATDAWVGRLIYLRMRELGMSFARQQAEKVQGPKNKGHKASKKPES